MRGFCINLFVLLSCCLIGGKVFAQKAVMQPETSTIALQTTQSDLKAEAIASKGKDDKTAFADKSLQAPQNNTEEKVVASDFTMGYNTVSYCFPIYQSNDDNHSVLDTKQSISATLPLEIMQPTVAAVNK